MFWFKTDGLACLVVFKVGIVAFDSEPSTPNSEETDCYRMQLAMAVPKNLEALKRFVTYTQLSIEDSGSKSVYSKAFYKAFQYFINSPSSQLRGQSTRHYQISDFQSYSPQVQGISLCVSSKLLQQ